MRCNSVRIKLLIKLCLYVSEEQLKIVCLDFFIAGSQTSSNFLGFAFLKVLKSQDIQEKIFNEIDAVIGDRPPCWNDNERLV